jgi:hypothetical protein
VTDARPGAHRDWCSKHDCDCGVEYGRIQITRAGTGRWRFRVWSPPTVDPLFPTIYGPGWESGIRWSQRSAEKAANRRSARMLARLSPVPWEDAGDRHHV